MTSAKVETSGLDSEAQKTDREPRKRLKDHLESLLQELESAGRTDRPVDALTASLEEIAQREATLLSKTLKRLARNRDTLSPWLRFMARRAFVAPLRELCRDSSLQAGVRLEAMEILMDLGEPVIRQEVERLRQEAAFLDRVLNAVEEATQENLPSLAASFPSLSPSAYRRVLDGVIRRASDNAFPFLELLIKSQEEASGEEIAAAVLEALVSLPRPESVHLLEEVARSSPSKARQKIARRSLYRLRNAHPDVAALVAAPLRPEVRSPLSPPEFKVLHALATFIDGSGTRLFFLAKAQPMGRVKEIFMWADDVKGIQTCQVAETSRKTMQSMVEKELLAGGGWIELHPAAWKALVEEYRSRNQISHSAAPEGVFQALELLDKVGEPPTRPLVYRELDEQAIRDDPYLLARSPRLFEIAELSGWYFPAGRLQPYLQALEEIENSKIVTSDVFKRERRGAVHKKAVAELFHHEERGRFGRRLEEMAFFLWATGRNEEAQMALAAALALNIQPEKNLQDHPWAEEMVRRSIALASEKGEPPGPESSIALPKLVIDPFAASTR